jgi:outer membrane lipoprotein-sorting protein
MKRPGMRFTIWSLSLAALAAFSSGCAVSNTKQVPRSEIRAAKTATKTDLLAAYNHLATGITSLNLSVELAPTTGSAYSGVIEQYHKVNAFILAQRPADIRVIGQDPVFSKNIFDMTSNGETFHIYIPSKNKFIIGPAAYEGTAEKPIENLRPQHLLDALFWPQIPAEDSTLFREDDETSARFYVLTVLRAHSTSEIERELWFDRSDLSLSRIQIFDREGLLLSDIHLADWQTVASTSPATAATQAGLSYPRQISLRRPHDDYQLELKVTKLALNESISVDRFRLLQPAGTDLVEVGKTGAGSKQ